MNILQDNNRIQKTIAGIIFLVTLWACYQLFFRVAPERVYFADRAMAEQFWNGKSEYSATANNQNIPIQLPGPLDAWAGGQPKTISIEAPSDGPVEVEIIFFDSHDQHPTELIIQRGASVSNVINVASGTGGAKDGWIDRGSPSAVNVCIPAGDATLSIKSVGGSWSALRGITVKEAPSIFAYAAAILGGLATLALLFFQAGRGANHRFYMGALGVGVIVVAAWFYNTRNLDLYVAINGYTPITYVHQAVNPQAMARDFTSGTALFDKSLFMHLYKVAYNLFNAAPQKLFPAIAGFQILALTLGLIALVRATVKDAPPAVYVISAAFALASSAIDLSMGGYARPTPLQSLLLYYNVSDALILFALAAFLTGRTLAPYILLAVAFCIYPTTALMGLFVIFAMQLAEPRGFFNKAHLAGLVMFAIIGGLWTFTHNDMSAVLSKGVTEEEFYRYTTFASFHLYPVDRGSLTAKHYFRFMPFLSFILLFIHYSGKNANDGPVNRRVVFGVAGAVALAVAGLLINHFKLNVTFVKLSLHRANELAVVLGLGIVARGLYEQIKNGSFAGRVAGAGALSAPFILGASYPLAYSLALVVKEPFTAIRQRILAPRHVATMGWTALIMAIIGFYAYLGIYGPLSPLSRFYEDPPRYLEAYVGNLTLLIAALVLGALAQWGKARDGIAPMFISFIVVGMSVFWLNQKLSYSKEWLQEASDYKQVQQWANATTPGQSLFMTDPGFFTGWRDYSLRSSFGVFHEWILMGWVYSTDRKVFNEGINRFKEFDSGGDLSEKIIPGRYGQVYKAVIERYYTLGDAWRLKLADNYGVDYFVLKKKKMDELSRDGRWAGSALPVAFENKSFLVLKATKG
ncbi:MAG: hypothetical protein HY751_01910 [Nitrospinae bacterium]|nr:hypothetical protein [Nitrospinota bacterium]